jgi:hypothetical protein
MPGPAQAVADRVGGLELGAIPIAHDPEALCLLLGVGHREGEGERRGDDADERLECAPRTAPSVYLAGSLRAESSIARWAGLSSRNLATCSASSLSMARQSHHSIMFSMRLADSGKSSRLWVMAQYEAPYLPQSRMAVAVYGQVTLASPNAPSRRRDATHRHADHPITDRPVRRNSTSCKTALNVLSFKEAPWWSLFLPEPIHRRDFSRWQ